MCNNSVGAIQNCLCRTIVLLKPYDLGTGKVLLEIQNIANISSSPAVNALIIVSNDTYVPMFSAYELDNAVLRSIGILIFVDKDKPEFLSVLLKNIGTCLK